MNKYPHQTVGITGGFEFLDELESRATTGLPEDEVLRLMDDVGIDAPDSALDDFRAGGLIAPFGSRIGLTTHGIRTTLLLRALNGGDLRDIFARLSQYDAGLWTYELVREGMTRQFLENLNNRPGFGRIYVCSPWIGLDQRDRDLLAHAMIREEQRGTRPDIYVICRPSEAGPTREQSALAPFLELGAAVLINSRLHTKLYIREPGRSGGYAMAILGSENITKSRYLELGIRINADTIMVNRLITYFWQLASVSQEV